MVGKSNHFRLLQQYQYRDIEGARCERYGTSACGIINLTSTSYTEFSASLAAYAGQSVRLAFVVTGTGGTVYLDDIYLKAALAPFVTIEGPHFLNTNVTERFVATLQSGSDDNLYIQWLSSFDNSMVSVSASGPYADTADIIWSAGGFDTLEVIAENRDTMVSYYYPVRVFDCGTVNNYPFNEDFEAGVLNCWDIMPNTSWQINTSGPEGSYTHSGINSLKSTADNTDHWIISQPFNVTDQNMELSWFEITDNYSGYSYYNDTMHYQLLISQSVDRSDLQAYSVVGTYSTYATTYKKHAISLANYYGTEIYIAFRHNASSSASSYNPISLYLDDIRVGMPDAPEVLLRGMNTVKTGDTAYFSVDVVSSINYTVTWNFGTNTQVITSGDDATVIWGNVPTGDYTYTVTVANTYGTTVKSGSIRVVNCNPVTTYPYIEKFEVNSDLGCWNPMTYSWSINTYSTGPDGTRGYLESPYNYNSSSWIISQGFVIPSGDDYLELSWYYQGVYENYSILVSTNGNTSLSDFTDTLYNIEDDEYDYNYSWAKHSLGLYPYAGQTIYLAIVTRSSYIYFDDIRIGTPSAPTATLSDVDNEIFNATPFTVNADVVTTAPITSYAWVADSGVVIASDTLSATLQWPNVSSGTYTYKYVVCNSYGCDSVVGEVVVTSCVDPITAYPYTVNYTSPNGYDVCWGGQGLGWTVSQSQACAVSQQGNEYYEHILQGKPFAIPATGTYEVEWSVSGMYGPRYALVADDGTSVDTLYSETMLSYNWSTRRVSLANYSGRTVSLYFVHTEGGMSSELRIQTIKVQEMTAPTVTIAVPSSAHAGEPVIVSAAVVSADTSLTYAWTFSSGTPATASTPTVSVIWNAPGTYPVSLVVTSIAGSVTASANINIVDCSDGNITDFPYNENFDAGVGCWNSIDADGDSYGWESVRYRMGIINNVGEMGQLANGGSYDAVVSWSYMPTSADGDGLALETHNYLCSPAIELPAETPMKLTFYVRSYIPDMPDHLALKISTTGTAADDFNRVIMPRMEFGSNNFVRREFSLAAYAGSTVYLAFEHSDTNNYGIIIDDVSITPVNGIAAVDEIPVSLYPNPVTNILTVDAESLRAIEVLDMCGRVVASQLEGNSVNLEDYAPGIYMVRVITDNGIATGKVVKQ